MKDVVGYEGIYAVNEKGGVWSYPNKRHGGKWMKPRFNLQGYKFVGLRKTGKRQRNFSIHKLVALAYIPNVQCKPQINHKNGIKTDNKVENLEWCTSSENLKHAFKIGLKSQDGEKHPSAFLSEREVEDIRQMRKSTNLTYQEIADKFGISGGHVGSIVSGFRWKHTKFDPPIPKKPIIAYAVLTPKGGVSKNSQVPQYAIYPKKRYAREHYKKWKVVPVYLSFTP